MKLDIIDNGISGLSLAIIPEDDTEVRLLAEVKLRLQTMKSKGWKNIRPPGTETTQEQWG